MNKLYIIIFLNFILSLKLYSQKSVADTVLSIEEVSVSTSRFKTFTSCNKIIEIDQNSPVSGYSLAEILESSGKISVRSQGSGNMASVSFRGAGTAHTAVLWNGFNLQQATDGGMNIALIPSFFLDDVSLQFGGASSLFGSGAMGGIIKLESQDDVNDDFCAKIYAGYGSFVNHAQGIMLSLGKKNISTKLRFFNAGGENNFKYINTTKFGSPAAKQTNASSNSTGFLLDNYINLTQKQTISSHFWFQDNYSQIPATMIAGQSLAERKDKSFRSTVEWKLVKENLSIQARTALFNSNLNYTDPLINLVSNIESFSSLSELESKIKILRSFELNTGLNSSFEKGISENYPEDKFRKGFALFSSLKYEPASGKVNVTLSSRQEYSDKKMTPLTWSLSSKYRIDKSLYITSSVSKNYRLPAFNDLYWQSWGNPDLKPESGICKELGLILIKNNATKKINANITFFDNHITDWIIWVPKASIWTPMNIRKVHSRGIETEIEYVFNINKINVYMAWQYSFTKSENEYDLNELLIGKQLIYTPLHSFSFPIRIKYKSYNFVFVGAFVGKRYYTADNKSFLDNYSLGNISISKCFENPKYSFLIKFSLNNILNEKYFVTAWYPTPPTNFNLSLSLELGNKERTKPETMY